MLLLILTLLGACVGSFLNVVIYRMPRGLSVQKPARSFCPVCGAGIPWYLNIPLLSWLLLRGLSACCHQPIAARYWLVEVACTALFFAIGSQFPYEPIIAQLLLCLWGAALLALLAMDWEQMVVEPRLALIAAVCGVCVGTLDPAMVESAAVQPWEGLVWSLGGALGGYLLFRLVALGGRWLFGRRVSRFPEPVEWQLRQVGEDVVLTAGGQDFCWSEVFLEQADRLELEAAEIPDLPDAQGRLVFTNDALLLPNGTRHSLEKFDSLAGRCRAVRQCREAMGSGDAWLALAIGALCGWQGMLFALVAGSCIGLVFALIWRIRRGVPMPFGPSLILAAFLWLFYGPQLLELYLSWL